MQLLRAKHPTAVSEYVAHQVCPTNDIATFPQRGVLILGGAEAYPEGFVWLQRSNPAVTDAAVELCSSQHDSGGQ